MWILPSPPWSYVSTQLLHVAGCDSNVSRPFVFPFSKAAAHDSILSDALGAIGHTPLIRLDKIARANGLECELCKDN